MENIKKELEVLISKEQFRIIPNIEKKTDSKIFINNQEYINFASNDYLGISTKENLRTEFLQQAKGLMSSTSARLLTGSSTEYKNLEQTLAKIFNKDSALIFNTGYQCNLGVISTLIGKGDVIFSDKLNHASIIDGMKLSDGDFYRFKHLDYDNLENLLKNKRDSYKRALIVSESIFSMDGDIANIEKLIELKEKYGCLLMVDEAHAFCCYGKDLSGLSETKNVDIITATFGKAVGSFGAFCVANNDIISYLTNRARSFIFSTSIPPINIEWTNWILNEKKNFVIEQKTKLDKLVLQIHNLLNEKKFNTTSNSHIIPIIIGSNEKTAKISEELKSKGYYIPAIRPPTVPEGTSRLRISLTADIEFKEFENVLDIISAKL